MNQIVTPTSDENTPESLKNIPNPEIIFGIVAPIGVDAKAIVATLNDELKTVQYQSRHIKITELMKSVPTGIVLQETPLEQRYASYIKYANKVREMLDDGDEGKGNDGLAMLAISAIQSARAQITKDQSSPALRTAYILDQFKRPEEIELLRRVYGRLFIQISIHATKQTRLSNLKAKIRETHPYGPTKDFSAEAELLIRRDQDEEGEQHGQRVVDAFPMAEVIIDGNDAKRTVEELSRFIKLAFGHNFITPTRDEYGMYMAKSASLRSADLSRQVGAAIFSPDGEVITLGSNEVPKPKGGTYFEGDEYDHRDFAHGADYNEVEKIRILQELLKLLHDADCLNLEVPEKPSPSLEELVQHALHAETGPKLKDARVMDLLEFGRQIHAEMSAICDAARLGKSISGATLFCTTFPCHMCAKLILGSGITRVVYIDPYPKSYAEEMYAKSIALESSFSSEEPHVLFEPFTGVAPYKYRDFFEKRKRKDSGGSARDWMEHHPRPNVNLIYPTYLKLEAIVASKLAKKLVHSEERGLLPDGEPGRHDQ